MTPVTIGVVGFITFVMRMVMVVARGIVLITGIDRTAGVGGFAVVLPYCSRQTSLFGEISVVADY